MSWDPKKGFVRIVIFKLPVLVYMALIFYSSSGPITSPTLNQIPDYYLHSLGYSLLCMLVFWALHEGLEASGGRWDYLIPILITILYGISDEFHQSFVPARDAELKDVFSDSAGALLGIVFIIILRRVISSFRSVRSA
jgi:VanZ family protein